MKNILIIGAGRSASSLINYLLQHSASLDTTVTVGDISLALAEQKTNKHPNGKAIAFDVNNSAQRENEITKAAVVVSMLPASLHYLVAKDCLRLKKHLVTASYVSKEIGLLDAEARAADILFLNECGLDPGIDHMSAMKVIHEIQNDGGKINSFKSYCGGLVAPEYNDNPWGYKFSWNPRNVILAGQGTAQYIENNQYKYIPYNRLFTQTEKIVVDGIGELEAYANRDSLSYREPYGLENIPTVLRGTLRMKGYCKAWNAFVQLGLTDDSYKIKDAEKLTYYDLLEAFLPNGNQSVKEKLAHFLGENKDSEVMQKLDWLGIFEKNKINLSDVSPAQILQDLLEKKWLLKPADKDMILMQHEFEFVKNAKKEKIISSLMVKGEDQTYTAMAKTVGLPMAIAVKLILTGKLKRRGVAIPIYPEIYNPILEELATLGIEFVEKKVSE
ncbi:MAG: saccharopine dehydrogenase C-terminal domain-containing protein [Bacteroidia bacterium]